MSQSQMYLFINTEGTKNWTIIALSNPTLGEENLIEGIAQMSAGNYISLNVNAESPEG